MAAGHSASHDAGHFVPAIHVMRGRSQSLLVMMCRNLALTGRATSGLIGRPRGTGKRRVQQNDHEQADAGRDGTTAVLTRSLHVAREPVYVVKHYSVNRHSLQAYSTTRLASLTLYANRASLSRAAPLLGIALLLRNALT